MVRLAGSWRLGDRLPVPAALDVPPSVRRLVFETREMTAWDTGLLTFVGRVLQQCDQRRVEADRAGLPEGVRRLLDLATAVPERKTGRGEASPPRVTRIGLKTLAVARGATEMLGFVGEALLAFLALLRGRARYRRVDLLLTIEEVGARALPIVTLISFLSGMILAFVGAVQLRTFGAGIYVADLVGIAMAQEMGALMTGIIMAGRTGAAFAAQLGTMRVNEEIDALTTLGISPAEFLVLPRMVALVLMTPLLTVYADLLGIFGGAFVGVTMLSLGPVQYWDQTVAALTVTHFAMGLTKSAVYGILIAIAGCLRGIQSGRSSAAVGLAATSAVVTAIVFIVVSDAILTVIYNALGL